MSTTFTVSANDIVQGALRLTGRFGAGDTIPNQDLTNVLQALNILVKELVTAGLPLWKIQDITVPTVQGQASYSIGPTATGTGAVVADRPMKIMQAIYINAQGNRNQLNVVSRYDYNTLGQLNVQAAPNQCWYLPSIPNGVLTLYDVPQDSASSIQLVSQTTFNDFNTLSDSPDFTQEWYAPLKWLTADAISLEYECKPQTIAKIERQAAYYRETVAGWGKEEVPVRFVPSQQYARGGR